MSRFKTIQFKEEDMQAIRELRGILQSHLYTEFSNRKAVMHAVHTMLESSKRHQRQLAEQGMFIFEPEPEK